MTSLFNPSSLGVLDLSDVAVLATVPSLLGGVDEDNLLVFSQEIEPPARSRLARAPC